MIGTTIGTTRLRLPVQVFSTGVLLELTGWERTIDTAQCRIGALGAEALKRGWVEVDSLSVNTCNQWIRSVPVEHEVLPEGSAARNFIDVIGVAQVRDYEL